MLTPKASVSVFPTETLTLEPGASRKGHRILGDSTGSTGKHGPTGSKVNPEDWFETFVPSRTDVSSE